MKINDWLHLKITKNKRKVSSKQESIKLCRYDEYWYGFIKHKLKCAYLDWELITRIKNEIDT